MTNYRTKGIPFMASGIDNDTIPPRPWGVHEAAAIEAKVDLLNCIAFLPRNVNEYTDLIHWHELAHTKWTTDFGIFGKTEPGVWDHILREPEINMLLLRRIKVDVSKAMRAFNFDEHPVPLLPRDAGLLWINLAYYLKDAGNTSLHEFAAKLEDRIRSGWEGNRAFQTCFDAVAAVIASPTAATRQLWAVKLAEYFNPPAPTPKLEAPMADDTAEAVTEEREAEAKSERDRLKTLHDDLDAAHPGASLTFIDNMEIHQHLTHTRPGQRIAVPGGLRDTGIIPTRFERYCTDRMLFQVRKASGGVLIDCSGSMAWDWEQLKRGLRSFPNVTVGAYQGTYGKHDGRLCVLAKKGRWSDYNPHEPRFNFGNEVDYQALLWLASQPEPRVWLSDGEVCGGNAKNTRENCAEIMRRAKILRIETLDGVLSYFGRKEVVGFRDTYHFSPIRTRRK